MLARQRKILAVLILLIVFGNILLLLHLPPTTISTAFYTDGSNLKPNRQIHFGSPRPRDDFNSSWIGIHVIRYKNRVSSAARVVAVQSTSKFDVELFLVTKNAPYTKLHKNDVVIFSAVARNGSDGDVGEFIAVNAWEIARIRHSVTRCCLLFTDGQLLATRATDKAIFLNNSLAAVQITCPNVFRDKERRQNNDVPVGVSLTYNTPCPTDGASYVRPTYPSVCLDRFCMAVCTKVAYGNINPSLIIEWMEYHMYMRVKRVVTFTYNLTSAATKVLNFYKRRGLVELRKFDFPRKDSPHHTVGDKVLASWTDEQMTVFDCHDRLRGYEFVGIFDLDEFLVPMEGNNFEELMKSLKHKFPFSASFTFDTQLHATDWTVNLNTSLHMIPQYTRRSEGMKDRPKVIHLPTRVVPGGISTHGIWPVAGYKRTHLTESQAVMKHYRQCRTHDVTHDWCSNLTTHTDNSMARIYAHIQANIADAKRQIGIS